MGVIRKGCPLFLVLDSRLISCERRWDGHAGPGGLPHDIGGAAGGVEGGGVGPDEAEALADLLVGELFEADTEGAR